MEIEVDLSSQNYLRKIWSVSMEKEVDSMSTEIFEKVLASVQSVHGKRGRVYLNTNI